VDWSLRIAVVALAFAVFAIWRAEELARFLHLADYQRTKAWKKNVSAVKHTVNHKPDDKSSLQYADKLGRILITSRQISCRVIQSSKREIEHGARTL
jgi:hypothetical protein